MLLCFDNTEVGDVLEPISQSFYMTDKMANGLLSFIVAHVIEIQITPELSIYYKMVDLYSLYTSYLKRITLKYPTKSTYQNLL